ncbi:MAG: hypothetical protein R3C44_01555 [Chloroflexota bacterium]
MNPDAYTSLYTHNKNAPNSFWKPLQPVSEATWDEASRRAMGLLPNMPDSDNMTSSDAVAAAVLSESMFGESRYKLSGLKSIYYSVARPLMPTWVRPMLRKVYQPAEDTQTLINWPLEDRFVRYQLALAGNVMDLLGQDHLDIVGLWP